MKKIYTSLFALVGILAFGQNISWQKTYGGKQSDYLNKIISTPDYGFILVGSSQSDDFISNKGGLDFVLLKLNENGVLEWNKSYGGNSNDMLNYVSLTRDGGYILGGDSFSEISGDKKSKNFGLSDFWIIKLNAEGSEEWQRSYGGSNTDKLISLNQTKDGGYILGGISDSNKNIEEDKSGKNENSFGNFDFWIIKINSKGDIQWQKTYGGSGYDYLVNCYEDEDGNFVAAGYSNSPKSGSKNIEIKGIGEYLVIKLDKTGKIISEFNFGGKGNDELKSFTLTEEGNYLLGGRSNSEKSLDKKEESKDYDFWVLESDKNGHIKWQKTIDVSNVDILIDVIKNNHLIKISGYSQTENSDEINDKKNVNNYIFIESNTENNSFSIKNIGGNKTDILNNVIETRDHSIILAGTSDSEISNDKKVDTIGKNDFWVLKLKNTSSEKNETSKKIEVYPNPTERFVNLISDVDSKNAELQVFNLNGQLLQRQTIQYTTTPIDLGGYPQGVYIIKLVTKEEVYTKKILKTGTK